MVGSYLGKAMVGPWGSKHQDHGFINNPSIISFYWWGGGLEDVLSSSEGMVFFGH